MKDEILIAELQKLDLDSGDILVVKVGSPDPKSPYHVVKLKRLKAMQDILHEALTNINATGIQSIIITHDVSFEKIAFKDGKFKVNK